MKLKIDAIDTLFFKDGKPFSMGEESWADGIFPPPPSVIYGALCSSILSSYNSYSNIKQEDLFNVLKITNIYYRIKNDNYFPLPLDFVYKKNKSAMEKNKEKNNKQYKVSLLINKNLNVLSSIPSKISVIKSDDEVEGLTNVLINDTTLSNYLHGHIDSDVEAIDINDHLIIESKIGIGIDNKKHSSEESKLYRVGLRRPGFFSIILEIEESEQYKNLTKFIKLGAEGKIAKIAQVDFSYNLNKDVSSTSKYFKLYLQTPSFFKKGWLPSWIDENSFIGVYNELELKLITAFIGKHLSLGGFDILKKVPKPMRRAVPAGSVYYFEILNGDFERVKNIFDNKSISEYNTDKLGYGLTLVGVYNA